MPTLLITRLLKLATPLVAATEVVPLAKLPEDSATVRVSVEPVPLVITLPNWSSTDTPTRDGPAGRDAEGCEVTTSLLSAAGLTVIGWSSPCSRRPGWCRTP